jgi:hypothetical protein
VTLPRTPTDARLPQRHNGLLSRPLKRPLGGQTGQDTGHNLDARGRIKSRSRMFAHPPPVLPHRRRPPSFSSQLQAQQSELILPLPGPEAVDCQLRDNLAACAGDKSNSAMMEFEVYASVYASRHPAMLCASPRRHAIALFSFFLWQPPYGDVPVRPWQRRILVVWRSEPCLFHGTRKIRSSRTP